MTTASPSRGVGSAQGLEPIFESLAASWAAAGRTVPGQRDAQWEDLAQAPYWPRHVPAGIVGAEDGLVLPVQERLGRTPTATMVPVVIGG
ncbi:hypothetical protein [Streptomyces sp. NPDC020667]|uniref:hypothetical protein n=1 Tax=Streptomyces sp. NPDC020667 TaxID=3154895 RepID=UPI0033F29615